MLKKFSKLRIYFLLSLMTITSALLPTFTVFANNRSVLIIGDSISQKSKEQICSSYGTRTTWETSNDGAGHESIIAQCGNLTLDATDGRKFNDAALTTYQKYNNKRFDVVIIELGTNDFDDNNGRKYINESKIKELIQAIGVNTQIYFVNNYRDGVDYSQNNNLYFNNAANQFSNVKIIDWASKATSNLEDGVHPTDTGKHILANLYYSVAPFSSNYSSGTGYSTNSTPNSQTLEFYNANNIKFYNASGNSCISGSYTGTIAGSNNEAKVWNYFVSAGIPKLSDNPAAIAGILGNIQQESSFNPFSKHGSHYGLYQASSSAFTAAVNTQGWSSYWGTTNAPEDINDAAIKIELDLLVADNLWSDNRFQKYLSSISDTIPNNAEGAKTYAELFLVALERAVTTGGNNNLQSSEAINLANNLHISGNWQGVESRRKNATEIYNKYANSTAIVTTKNLCLVGNSPYTGEGIPEYIQTDPRWKNAPYSTSTIGVSGCGPTSFAMMLTALTGIEYLPTQVANAAANDNAFGNQYVSGAGSRHTITQALAKKYGLQYQALDTCDINTINQYLNDGWMIHTVGNGSQPFTSGGHFIGITGIKDGKWYVADSAHGNKYYSPNDVIKGMRCGQSNMSVKAIRK